MLVAQVFIVRMLVAIVKYSRYYMQAIVGVTALRRAMSHAVAANIVPADWKA